MTDAQRRRWMELVREFRADCGWSDADLNDADIIDRTSGHALLALWLEVKGRSVAYTTVTS